MHPETWVSIVFWVVALTASVLYGWNAVAIHSPPRKEAKDRSNEESKEELVYPPAWWWHQRWLNFLGALVGWLALWFLGRKYVGCLFNACTVVPDAWDVTAALIAFVGVTGFLPGTFVSFLSSFSGLAAKLAELLAAWITKLK